MTGLRKELVTRLTGALIGFAAVAAAGCVATPVVAQRGYYESAPIYQDDFIYRPPPRRAYPPQGYYPQPGYYPDQGYQDPYRRERGYYHQPRQRYAPQPHFYDKEAAKNHWRAQKEAQKRAIKRGYYNQPQQGFGGGFGGGAGGGFPGRGGAGATALD